MKHLHLSKTGYKAKGCNKAVKYKQIKVADCYTENRNTLFWSPFLVLLRYTLCSYSRKNLSSFDLRV